MNALAVLADLSRRGVWFDVEPRPGRGLVLLIDDPAGAIDDELDAAIRANRDLIVAAVWGRRNGHALTPCTVCGEAVMVAVDNQKGRPCVMTPRCPGRHVPPARARSARPETTSQPTLLDDAPVASRHGAQFSPEVLDVIAPLLVRGEQVHDPFAGPGVRLAALCDRLGCTYSGTDIEDWPGHDRRVMVGSALDPITYPADEFRVVTSPTYVNKRLADYPDGPTPNTKIKGRRDYSLWLGRPLHPDNLARTTGRPARAEDYWRLHALAVKCWPTAVIVNVDEPIGERWQAVLIAEGYRVDQVIPAFTRRYGGLDNAEKRADHEVVIVAEREDHNR